jgi:hypothetical protein
LGEEDLIYTAWRDGEPNTLSGCGHMTTVGQWTMTPCDAKLDAAICQINTGVCVCVHTCLCACLCVCLINRVIQYMNMCVS